MTLLTEAFRHVASLTKFKDLQDQKDELNEEQKSEDAKITANMRWDFNEQKKIEENSFCKMMLGCSSRNRLMLAKAEREI